MGGLRTAIERGKSWVAVVRARRPLLDHLVRTQAHYSSVGGGIQAGGVTYFAFLSFFPLLAVAFFAVGYVADVFPQAADGLVQGIEQVLPGLVGDGDGEISLDAIRSSAGTVGLLGLTGLLYSGLGWIAALRGALRVVFELPQREKPNLVVGAVRDLVTLAVIGLTLVLSVAVSGVVGGFSQDVLDWLDLGQGAAPALAVVSVLVGLTASCLLFFALFVLLARPHTPRRSLWSGALLGAVGFEVLKWASSYLFAATRGQPAFQAFGIALILVVWINYFSRVVLYAAAWAHTSAQSRAARRTVDDDGVESADARALRERVEAARSGIVPEAADAKPVGASVAEVATPRRLPAFLTGVGVGAATVAVLRRVGGKLATGRRHRPWRMAVRRSLLSWEITSRGISLGQDAVHWPMLVQPPKPSWSCWATMFTTRVQRSA